MEELRMIIRTVALMILIAGLFIGACANERIVEQNNPASDYGPRDPYDPRLQRRPLGPWDLRQNQQQLGPSTWYGCPQQSPRCFPE